MKKSSLFLFIFQIKDNRTPLFCEIVCHVYQNKDPDDNLEITGKKKFLYFSLKEKRKERDKKRKKEKREKKKAEKRKSKKNKVRFCHFPSFLSIRFCFFVFHSLSLLCGKDGNKRRREQTQKKENTKEKKKFLVIFLFFFRNL